METLVSIPVIISKKNGYPLIEIRKTITDINIMKKILSCAFRGVPITIMPQFTDKMQSINSMIEKGIIHKGEKEGEYNFVF